MKIVPRISLTGSDALSADEVMAHLLKSRKIKDMDAFLNPPSPLELTLKDFGFSTEITTAITLLKKVKKSSKTVIVYTDYDADGITGGAILWETLHLMGFNVLPYVPHRQHEGYGFSVKGIDAIQEKHQPGLIISVDHGITAVDQIAYAKKLGIPVIITDHHAKQKKIPTDAEAIFHIPVLSGSSVAYFFAKEVFTKLAKEDDKNFKKLTRNFKTDYLMLAAIGTVADLVPLIGPARAVVKHGLEKFCDCTRLGILELMNEGRIKNNIITPHEIGFIIAPRINAIGRLGHALDALRLLCTNKKDQAVELAGVIGQHNESRKGLVDKALKQAKKQVEEMIEKNGLPRLIIVRGDDWHEGIIGLIASKLAEQYFRATLVITKSEDYLKASGRSPASVNITELLTGWKHHFINYGGHRQAAGFSILEENYDAFLKEVTDSMEKLIPENALEHILTPDMEISAGYATIGLAKKLAVLEPFGMGNLKPVFSSHVFVKDIKQMGKEKKHLKIIVQDANHGLPVDMVAFSKGADFEKLSRNQAITVVYNLDINEWNGRTSVQGKLIHWQER